MKEQLEKYSNILKESEQKITTFRSKHPDWPLEPSDLTIIEKQEATNMRELEEISKKLDVVKQRATAITTSNVRTPDYDDVLANFKVLTAEMNRVKIERDDMINQKKLYSDPEFQQYLDEVIKKQIAEKKIQEAKAELAITQKKSQLYGANDKATPFGKVPFPINHLDNIRQGKEWREAFCEQHHLKYQEADSAATFESKVGDVFEVKQESIQIRFAGEDGVAIKVAVELYLKSCENKAVLKHHVLSNDKGFQERVEQEVAAQLRAKGNDEGDINGKKLADFPQEPITSLVMP